MADFKTDLEIAREADKKPIINLAKEKLSISEQDLIPFGHYKAKINSNFFFFGIAFLCFLRLNLIS